MPPGLSLCSSSVISGTSTASTSTVTALGFSGSCAGLRADFGLSGVVGVSLLRLEVGWLVHATTSRL
ncbi:hypothetical protein LC608_25785 [Nostoc sp. XA010]|uniref:hypothetical protein n=1 Tax=Nostoc sp. XA010 TaxID=2780407 RepID=UPI001E420551|nr:hypothetical protein [Nostoc sp. XA010]MCC5660326.1 hypothetical protein [Nostoc sp. XA010]